jgi:ribosomal protein S18 acetylase RimI-like enzyme
MRGRSTDEPGVLDTDAIPVRALRADDLDAIVRIDERITGRARRRFYEPKVAAALRDSGVHVSLVAECDGLPVGFAMTTVYYGEFGLPEPVAVLDTLGVHPDFRGRHVATALLRQLERNLRGLGIDRIETQVDWDQGDLLGFLRSHGFGPIPRLALARPLT